MGIGEESAKGTVTLEDDTFDAWYEPMVDHGIVTGVIGLAVNVTE